MIWTLIALLFVGTNALAAGMWFGIAVTWSHKPPLPAITLTVLILAVAAMVFVNGPLAVVAAGISLFSAGALYVDS